jgi:hypothetical protein
MKEKIIWVVSHQIPRSIMVGFFKKEKDAKSQGDKMKYLTKYIIIARLKLAFWIIAYLFFSYNIYMIIIGEDIIK